MPQLYAELEGGQGQEVELLDEEEIDDEVTDADDATEKRKRRAIGMSSGAVGKEGVTPCSIYEDWSPKPLRGDPNKVGPVDSLCSSPVLCMA